LELFGKHPKDDLNELAVASLQIVRKIETVNVVIVGASGFLGGWLTSYFSYMSSRGLFRGTLTLIVRSENSLAEFQTILSASNSTILTSTSLESHSFSELNSDRTIILFAATSTSTSGLKISETTGQSIQLAEKLVQKISRRDLTFIHLSSGGLYETDARSKKAIPGVFETKKSSTDSYVQEKLNLESWSKQMYLEGYFEVRNPRLFSFYGPGLQMDRHYAIAEFMKCALGGLPIVIRGNPENLRSYLYPTDAISQIVQQCLPEEPIHSQIGSAKPISILEVAKIISSEFNVPYTVSENHLVEIDHYVPLDVPDVNQKDFLMGLKDWAEWLNNGK
jgi:dTDP-glucose 4,6-dehydratase